MADKTYVSDAVQKQRTRDQEARDAYQKATGTGPAPTISKTAEATFNPALRGGEKSQDEVKASGGLGAIAARMKKKREEEEEAKRQKEMENSQQRTALKNAYTK